MGNEDHKRRNLNWTNNSQCPPKNKWNSQKSHAGCPGRETSQRRELPDHAAPPGAPRIGLGRRKGFQSNIYSETWRNLEKAHHSVRFSLEHGRGTMEMFAGDGKPKVKNSTGESAKSYPMLLHAPVLGDLTWIACRSAPHTYHWSVKPKYAKFTVLVGQEIQINTWTRYLVLNPIFLRQ